MTDEVTIHEIAIPIAGDRSLVTVAAGSRREAPAAGTVIP
jgi:hypothetical protein